MMLMKRSKVIPKPSSQFLSVECKKCNNSMVVYSHTTSKIYCKVCNELLAENTGGKAIIYGKIIKRLDNP